MFVLDELRCALPLAAVDRVVRAVEITSLPKAPEIIRGVINLQGQIIPVVDVRRRFGLPARKLSLEDRFIIASASRRLVALVADSVTGVREHDGRQASETGQTLSFAPYLKGVAKLPDGLVLIYDLDLFLSLDEQKGLDAALSGGAG